MKYSVHSTSVAKTKGKTSIKESEIVFGLTSDSADTLANPAEVFLSSLSACILKSLERFSSILKFEYLHADIAVNAVRLEKPPRMDKIYYDLTIYTNEAHLNVELLQKNIEKFGTIFNTVKTSCTISGQIHLVSE
ncbi:OsmC family protein [Portibacter lacus]|uniref:OsmC/Ohr family stress-inducible protein n=1 Tax=Portibacter lacus TaxID=1099794 RepID=A0AA37SMI3_9BACT|nr:OsmC family protein [Portibacter lacus]GLR16532.1 OsmC/Ohr family stress-inducible protein [Portibacter lacus]